MKYINLLPKEKQRELAYESVFTGMVRFVELALLTFALVFVAQFGAWSYLQNYDRELDAKISDIQKISNKEDNAKLKAQITKINGQINDFKNLIEATPAWSRALNRIVYHIPEGMKIASLNASLDTKKVEIAGYSPTRDLVINFYNEVTTDTDNFQSIDYPLENLAKPNDVNFHFTIAVKDDLLKQ